MPKSYSDEFKKEAVHLLETSGKRITHIERDLGIPHPMLEVIPTQLKAISYAKSIY